MNKIATKILVILTLFTLGACGTSTVQNAIRKGAEPLSVNEIFSLVSNNTIHLVSSDFDTFVFMAENGKMAAKSLENTEDSGQWDLKNDATLCMKYNTWYYGDVKCYSVYQEEKKGSYLLYTGNGAFAYTATVANGNTRHLQIGNKGSQSEFVREQLRKGGTDTRSSSSNTPPSLNTPNDQPEASYEEINHSVKAMAKDCPDCNLEDADLRQAQLIGANLKGANLRGADLSRANLRRANLEGADLSGATLLSTNLPGANLKNADLSGADLTGSNLIQADFSGADLDNSILKNTLKEGTKGLK